MKKQVCVLLVLLACFFLPAVAFAADGEIDVQLNGANLQIQDAAPVNEDGRVYVPFRAVFEALGAIVEYDKESDTITAQKGDTAVQFVIGSTDVTVDGKTVTTDAASFVRDGRTYVPVRFAAQSLGVTVGWDAARQTVVMVDKAALKEAAKGQYTLMEKYMVYSESFNKEPMAIKGTLKFDLQVADGSGADAVMIPITGTMKLDGLSTAEIASMNVATELDLNQLKKAIEQAGEMTEEDKRVMEQMQSFDMDVIANMETGKVYMKSALFGLSGMDGTAWYMMDLEQMLQGSGMDLQTLLESTSQQDSYEAVVVSMIDGLPVTDALTCATMLESLNQYQDKNFQKVGSNYVSTLKQETEGVSVAVSLTLKTEGDKVTGYAQSMAMYMGTAPIMTMKVDQSGRQATMNMEMNVDGMMTMKLDGDMRYTATAEKPQSAPASGEKVIDLMEQLNQAA